ncbi:MAG: ribosome-associated translation inhibitor RaiA [Deltaproteobacteria bacterium]|nr:MAG: ribosome-associated translation inhibitor RaiA [Deltaproteobacteria bacterium]
MQINMTFRHVDPVANLKEYVEEKLQKVKKYLHEPIEAHVVLSTEKFRHTVEVNIMADNGIMINGVESMEDIQAAIDNVMDKIERQIKKQREKLKRTKPKGYEFKMHILSLDREEEEKRPKLIRSKNYSAKPMSIDEAIEQLKTLKNDFIIFTNAKTEAVNVVYRRKDGNFGLIEPE